ncbi:MAG: BA14K family protein [Hyphomicrobiales bacterium]|nr:BA14K family protein [Hyphomicrobiales bacterium]
MFRNCPPIFALAIVCSAVAVPASAASKYDGDWSVVITTNNGACQPSVRYGIQIQNGQVIAGNGAASVDGRVTRVGTVMVNVQAGGQWAEGSGRLGKVSGSGIWQGQGSAGACDGTWVAQRAVPDVERNAPIYDYAPQALAPNGGSVAARAAACAARFHTYNAATGTYLGADRRQHRCP